MNRRDFMLDGCAACIGGGAMLALLDGCTAPYVAGTIDGSDMVVPTSAFLSESGDGFRSFVTVQNEALQYPVAIYRFSHDAFVALLMRCTHKGTQVLAFDEGLECPAHGSEYDNRGKVTFGPAEQALRTLPVTVSNDMLRISLR